MKQSPVVDQLPLVEMEVLNYEGVLETKPIDMYEAVNQVNIGHVYFHKHDRYGWSFDKELYLDYLYEEFNKTPRGAMLFGDLENGFSNEAATELIASTLKRTFNNLMRN